jgi:hypothetical protein
MPSRDPGTFPLEQLQQWMQSVLQNPEGTDVSGILPAISEVIEASSQQSSEQRLQVYCNAYFARLLDCLREEFRTLCQFLGQEIFDGLAVVYLNLYPSRTYTLGELGADFPRFLEESRDQFRDPDAGELPPWVRFMVDLATLERVQSEVFDGPGTEGLKNVLSPDDLKQITPESWLQTRLEPAPCLRLLSLGYPVHEFTTAIRLNPEAQLSDPRPTWLAVTRRQYVLRRISLEEQEYQVLRRLVDGATIDQALEAVTKTMHIETLESLVKDIERWFESWTIEGFFIAVA